MITQGGVEVKGAAALSISSKPILATPEITSHEKTIPLCQWWDTYRLNLKLLPFIRSPTKTTGTISSNRRPSVPLRFETTSSGLLIQTLQEKYQLTGINYIEQT